VCYHARVKLIAFARVVTFCLAASSSASPSPSPSPSPPSPPAPDAEWWRGDVFYEIYPRAFADSNGDGVGDLRGIAQHLDDLKALGVDDLWLTPINPSPSEHGYDVTDYEDVAQDLGGLAALDELVKAAHARHMRIVIDFVLNHSSVKHPWFTAHPEYYVWRDKPDDRFRRPWDNANVWHRAPTTTTSTTTTPASDRVYLGLFWSGMPDLNLANEDVVKAMEHALLFWRKRGVDGFRIDAARYLVEGEDGTMADTKATHELLARIRRDVDAVPPANGASPALFIGEIWTDDATIASYAADVDLAFSFGIAKGIVDSLADNSRSPLVEALQSAEAAFAVGSPLVGDARSSARDVSFQAPFLTNHDMPRIARVLAGSPGSPSDAAVDVSKTAATSAHVLDAKLRLAAATLMALPGTPFLYYAEEVGMAGAAPRNAHDDASQRTHLEWRDVAAERADPHSLWSAYRELLALRHGPAREVLARGALERLHVDGGGRGAFAMARSAKPDQARVVFVANFADAPAVFDVDAVVGRGLAPVLCASPVAVISVEKEKLHATLPAFGFAFVELE